METNNPQDKEYPYFEATKKIKQKKAPKGPAYGPAPDRRPKKSKGMKGY